MIWDKDISFEAYSKKKDEWFNDPDHFLGDPPISAQYALDLIFKTLVDDKEIILILPLCQKTQSKLTQLC